MCAHLGACSTGTYRGLVEKLDYIKRLGVNAIELLPVHEFNELEYYQVWPFMQSSSLLIQQEVFLIDCMPLFRSSRARTSTDSISGGTPQPPSLHPWPATARQRWRVGGETQWLMSSRPW